MGVWILRGLLEGKNVAVMVDPVTEKPFGPLFGSGEDCEDFISWCVAQDFDPRSRLLDMYELHLRWKLESAQDGMGIDARAQDEPAPLNETPPSYMTMAERVRVCFREDPCMAMSIETLLSQLGVKEPKFQSLRTTLARLCKDGELQRVGRGLYVMGTRFQDRRMSPTGTVEVSCHQVTAASATTPAGTYSSTEGYDPSQEGN